MTQFRITLINGQYEYLNLPNISSLEELFVYITLPPVSEFLTDPLLIIPIQSILKIEMA